MYESISMLHCDLLIDRYLDIGISQDMIIILNEYYSLYSTWGPICQHKNLASRHQIDMSKVYALKLEFSIIELLMISFINLFTS